MSSSYSTTWSEATSKFVQAAQASQARMIKLKLSPELTSPTSEPLHIDVAVWESDDSPTKDALVYTAGVHGVEGFAGSAIMIMLCSKIKQNQLPSGMKIIFIHVINPYGMSHWRRWNEENVDLNRNNLASDADFVIRRDTPNAVYVKYDDFINPTKKLSACDCFTPRLICLICKEGFNNGKQALAGGQSHTSRGLFYGGVQWEETPRRVFQMLESEGISSTSTTLQNMFHVDIHTGVGPFKHDSLLAENVFLPELEEMLGTRGALKGCDWHLDGIGDWVQFPSQEGQDMAGRVKEEGMCTVTTSTVGPSIVITSTVGKLVTSQIQTVDYSVDRITRALDQITQLSEEPEHCNGESKETEDILINVDGGKDGVTKKAKDGVAYEAKGHIGGGLFYKSIPRRVQEKGKFVSVTQEFGTIKGTKIFSLLRAENALTFDKESSDVTSGDGGGGGSGGSSSSDILFSSPERQRLFNAFCPADPAWRSFVLARGEIVFDLARKKLLSMVSKSK